jgi:tetratricopeptide (TPR) repeat protein
MLKGCPMRSCVLKYNGFNHYMKSMEEKTSEERQKESVSNDAVKDKTKNKGISGIKIFGFMILILAIIAIVAVPAYEKYQFTKTTDADFVSVPNKDLDADTLEVMKTKYDEAEETLKKNGYDLEANLAKADILTTMQENDKAIAIYEKLQELYPSDARSFEELGSIYLSQKNYPKAEEQLAMAIKKDTGNIKAYMQLSSVYRADGKESTDKETVKKFYEDGIAAIGEDHKLQLVDEYAAYLARIKEYGKAIDQVNVLLASSPDDEDLKARIASLQAKMVTDKASDAQTTATPSQTDATAPALVPAQ